MMPEQQSFDAIVVGAGFAGMYQLYRLRQQGLSVRVYEAGSDVGGTWYWNRYPGARCDVQSMEYSYQFSDDLQQEWNWSERYAPQPEILSYANHVADRFDLRPDIQFNTKVISAHFDKSGSRWRITTDTGETVSAKYFIMATGCLSSANTPSFKGLASFKGDTYHLPWSAPDRPPFSRSRSSPNRPRIYTCFSAPRTIPCRRAMAKWNRIFATTSKPIMENVANLLRAPGTEFCVRPMTYRP
jgi:cyclohexanone monooxygenase